jgi:hypothetical protein
VLQTQVFFTLLPKLPSVNNNCFLGPPPSPFFHTNCDMPPARTSTIANHLTCAPPTRTHSHCSAHPPVALFSVVVPSLRYQNIHFLGPTAAGLQPGGIGTHKNWHTQYRLSGNAAATCGSLRGRVHAAGVPNGCYAAVWACVVQLQLLARHQLHDNGAAGRTVPARLQRSGRATAVLPCCRSAAVAPGCYTKPFLLCRVASLVVVCCALAPPAVQLPPTAMLTSPAACVRTGRLAVACSCSRRAPAAVSMPTAAAPHRCRTPLRGGA